MSKKQALPLLQQTPWHHRQAGRQVEARTKQHRHLLLCALAEILVFHLLLRLELERRHRTAEHHVQGLHGVLKDSLIAQTTTT